MGLEGGAVWLFRRLRVLGIFETLPPAFQERLKRLAFSTAALGLRIEDEAVAALEILDRGGIPVVLIKGVARRALAPRFPYLDARYTTDVDLLLPEMAAPEAHKLLIARGYRPTPPPVFPEHHHLPGLVRDRGVAVELHFSTSVRVPPAVAWTRATDGGSEVEWAGMVVRVPSPTEMAWAAATHAITGSLVQGFRLQHFLEVAALGAVPGAVDWDVLARRTGDEETFEPESGESLPERLTRQWINGAIQCLAPEARPKAHAWDPLDLEALFLWRLQVVGRKPRLGRALTERLLEEGPRAMLGCRMEGAPPGARGLPRMRRYIAGRVSRLAFRAWRMAR